MSSLNYCQKLSFEKINLIEKNSLFYFYEYKKSKKSFTCGKSMLIVDTDMFRFFIVLSALILKGLLKV